jgi:alpha-glucuronidase
VRTANRLFRLTLLGFVFASSLCLRADSGYEAWLRYAPLNPSQLRQYKTLPSLVVAPDDSIVLQSAAEELVHGVSMMVGRTLRVQKEFPSEPAIVLATSETLQRLAPALKFPSQLKEDGFWLTSAAINKKQYLVISSPNDRGVLYGAFALLRKIAFGESILRLNETQQPSESLRWVNEWDNLNGTIERGYAGPSIFFENGAVRIDLARVRDYARLLASLGINGCVANNVNADPRVLQDDFLVQLARIAAEFRLWGVRLGLAANFASPKEIGGLETFDPLDPAVMRWWEGRIDSIYKHIPDFGGFVMKADSEGQAGPASYGRSPSEAANVIARALKPRGGVLFYRAFVYNHHLDWRNPRNDRARAAYDIFHPLDGKFEDNVIIQIKYGPIDFQVREPASPLFAGLQNTNEAIELQITQEYTGQQRHVCFLAPLWKTILDFDFHVAPAATPVKDLVRGKTFQRPLGGFVGVSNVGMNNWLGNPMAMANLYAFGRLAWDANLGAKKIADEWTRLTFGNDPLVVRTVEDIKLSSWQTYENYTGPLGLQTLTNILGPHYGPGVESSERNGWGQWHDADHEGVGLDRSATSGTGFTDQYPATVAREYESLQTTPDNLLLFFHHVPYTYKLHPGKTVIQEIYDRHYEGAERVQGYVDQWKALRGHMDEERWAFILERLKYQAGHAIVWRDAVCNWFLAESGIADAKGRIGHHPERIEAETMQLQGFLPIDISPPENASGGKGVECAASHCVAATKFAGKPGRYDISTQYFDQSNGVSTFRLFVNDERVDQWRANDHLPATTPNGDSSTRRWTTGIPLRRGDEIRVEGIPDGDEHAPFDYLEIQPSQLLNGHQN